MTTPPIALPTPSHHPTPTTPPKIFHVLIIGGSITGLTLAHCLTAAGISYTILEKHRDLVAPLGGVIGVAPTGARILNQLGLFNALNEIAQGIRVLRTGFPDGTGVSQTWVSEFAGRYGYGFSIVTRQQLLEVLYTGLGEKARETVHGGKEATKICHEGGVVKVHTRDGGVYTGDLVVGADGLHSIARSEVLKMAGRKALAETSNLAAAYRVHVGLSTSIPGLTTGEQIIRSYNGFAIFVFCGKDGELGWFVTEKLDRRYTYPDRPVYTQEDALAYCKSLSGVQVWGGITFGAVFQARTSFSHALVDEHVFSTWNAGRVVCLGDSVVKISPNSGLGASLGMECAAALTNKLHALLSSTKAKPNSKPSAGAIETLLNEYTRAQHSRARMIGFASYRVIRLHARDGWFNALIGGFVLRSERLAVFWTTLIMNGGVRLESRGVPRRGVDRGVLKDGSWWRGFRDVRSVLVLVLVVVLLVAVLV
ncbi:hypothetical protein BJY00DRAFT_323394 [Aspergillus carlsbadensis]|nr:hypothetical protein BJY00DRAFT_323394 [Aspergillus carlsbadensis]